METPRPEEENITKDIRNIFRLKAKINYTAIKDIKNLFRLKAKLNYTAIKEIKNLSRPEKKSS